MEKILLIKGDNINHVRTDKYLKYFNEKNVETFYLGWDRTKKHETSKYNCKYLLHGGGLGGKLTMVFYPLWIILLFFHLLFLRRIKEMNVIAVNFDVAIAVYCVSKIRRFDYIYEIHDEFALSYNMSKFFYKLVSRIDNMFMRNAKLVIHVDENRVNYKDCNWIVIENSPNDFYEGKSPDYSEMTPTFAVTGMLAKQRGIDEILNFAKDNANLNFLIVGNSFNYSSPLLKLSNVNYLDYMKQDELFNLLRSCCGIFSLYDASLEINRLAASNKLYDAMMLGIPVITNFDVANSDFVEKEEVGIVLDYNYNSTWDVLVRDDYVAKAIKLGKKGRDIYLKKFRFDLMIEKRLSQYLN